MQSKILTKAQCKSYKERKGGSKKDPTGIFNGRVKPIFKEMLEYWFPRRKEIQKLIEVKDGKA